MPLADRTRFVGVNDAGIRVGQSHPHAVLTDHEIELVLRLRAEGWLYRQLAEKFEVSRGCVVKVCDGTRRNKRAVAWKRVSVHSVSADVASVQSSTATSTCAAAPPESATRSAKGVIER